MDQNLVKLAKLCFNPKNNDGELRVAPGLLKDVSASFHPYERGESQIYWEGSEKEWKNAVSNAVRECK
jgi:hypothetical protein